jgi:hypothetical protein
MNASLIRSLLTCLAAVGFTVGTTHAADPNVPGKPALNTPAAGSFAAGCSTYGYACPSGLTCAVLAAPPKQIPPLTFIGYQCRKSNQYALLPGQCPPGYVTGLNGCQPGPAACVEGVKPAWIWWNKVTIPLADGTGYQCPFTHSTLVNSQ